ncbi:MAG: hypothetical protein KDI98_01635 [Hyphomicrobiaceae bacterium]|nr:hypothetical protein [Hyphomicrobiaceae bacterium]
MTTGRSMRVWCLAGSMAAVLGLAGCAGTGIDTLIGGREPVTPTGPQAGSTQGLPDPFVQATADSLCPPLETRSGTEIYTIYARGQENTGTGVRYQATISQTARECQVVAGQLLVNVGTAGRVLMGPQGEPAIVDLPLRLVVVERPSGNVLHSEMRPVRAVIEPGQTSAVFSDVTNGLVIALPPSRESRIIYVGFDPDGGNR